MVSFTNFAVLALFLSTTSLQTLASPTPSSQLVKRWDRTYFKIHAIANQDTWEKNEIADCINGKVPSYIYLTHVKVALQRQV